MMFLEDGTEVIFTPAGVTSYTPTSEGVLVEFCGQGSSIKSSKNLVSWQDAEKKAKTAFGGGYRVCRKAWQEFNK